MPILRNGIHGENSYYIVLSPQDKWYMAGTNVGSRNDSIPSFPFSAGQSSPHHQLHFYKRREKRIDFKMPTSNSICFKWVSCPKRQTCINLNIPIHFPQEGKLFGWDMIFALMNALSLFIVFSFQCLCISRILRYLPMIYKKGTQLSHQN